MSHQGHAVISSFQSFLCCEVAPSFQRAKKESVINIDYLLMIIESNDSESNLPDKTVNHLSQSYRTG